jgi:hypothetical protein
MRETEASTGTRRRRDAPNGAEPDGIHFRRAKSDRQRGTPADYNPAGKDAVAATLILEGYLTYKRMQGNA